MRSITTGAGLAILGACVLGAAAISSSKGSQAFAQIGTERRVVNYGVTNATDGYYIWGFLFRVWSDGVIERRCTGGIGWNDDGSGWRWFKYPEPSTSWEVVDDGQTPSFQSTDTNTDGSVDSADISNVLINFGATQEVTPTPPIECQTSTIP